MDMLLTEMKDAELLNLVALDLSAAMRTNPYLRGLSLNGYYDMATPFFGTEYDLGHMRLDRSVRPNLRFAYAHLQTYEARRARNGLK